MGQGDLEECEACGGSGEANRHYKKEEDGEHKERGRRRGQRGKEKKKKRLGESEKERDLRIIIKNSFFLQSYHSELLLLKILAIER